MRGTAVALGASELPHHLHAHIQASSTLQTSRNVPWTTCSLLSAGTDCVLEAVPVSLSRLQSLKPAWLDKGAVTSSHESLDPLCLLSALWQPSEGSPAQFTDLTALEGPWVSLQLRKLRPWRENELAKVPQFIRWSLGKHFLSICYAHSIILGAGGTDKKVLGK